MIQKASTSMANILLKRQTAFTEQTLPLSSTGVTVSLAPPQSRLVFRGDKAAAEACGKTLGVTLSSDACRATTGSNGSVLWLGPDEWLLLLPDSASDAATAKLTKSMAKHPHSLVDVSHRQIGLTLVGDQSEELLGSSCLLDLDHAAFPVGTCTRTIFGKAEIILWRTGKSAFHVEVWRSFADYVVGVMDQSRYGLGHQ
jgi:sarcosine oxidase, subunit gamma